VGLTTLLVAALTAIVVLAVRNNADSPVARLTVRSPTPAG
jgi:hypothetical protein